MPHLPLKITQGVTTVETTTLNMIGISACNLIRYKPDPQGLMLVETLGGWSRFYGNVITSTVRALWGWEDTNANKWIAYGTSSTTSSSLVAIQCFTNSSGITQASTSTNNIYNLTPTYLSDSSPATFQTTAGSPVVLVTDNITLGLSSGDSVYLTTPVSVGGIVLLGQYTVISISTNQYEIVASNLLGASNPAVYSTVASPLTVTGGSLTPGSPSTITLTFATQASIPFPVGEAVIVSGVVPLTWNGAYIVTAATTASVTFATALSSGSYSSGGTVENQGVTPVLVTTSGSSIVTGYFPDHGFSVGSTFAILNQTNLGGLTLFGNYLVQSITGTYGFTFTAGSQATSSSTGFVGGLLVTGGSSTSSAVTLNFSIAGFAEQIITVTGGSASGSHVTLTWSTPSYTFTIGETIVVAGMTPTAWNGSYVVTSSTSGSVTYASAASGSFSIGGTVRNAPFNIGAHISVAGVTNSSSGSPNSWNGIFAVTGVTASSVTYALSGSALTWLSGGQVVDNGGDVGLVYNFTGTPSSSGTGYGVGGYGVGGYGVGTLQTSFASGSNIFASNWTLDNWGQALVACPIGFTPITYPLNTPPYQPIYYWDPTTGTSQAIVIVAGPPASNGVFVAMPQRQMIAWGSTFTGIIDPLLVRWCDVSNYNVWVAQVTNQAGSFRISTGSAIIGAMQTPQQGLIWTDVGVWSMQYIGPPYVYSFNQVGIGCGLVARKAAGIMNGIVYWMGQRQFFFLTSEGVQAIPCQIWDNVFQNLDLANLGKITCAVNSLFGEVTWYYPVVGGNGEVSNYVKYNVMLQQWDYGTLARSAWIDSSVLGPPIGYDPVNQYIYQHEISSYADASTIQSTLTTGYFTLDEGDHKVFIDQFWPDFKWGYYGQAQNASVTITVNAADYPNSTPLTYGPFTVTSATPYFSPRVRGRLISITIATQSTGTFWRLGDSRFRYQLDGKF